MVSPWPAALALSVLCFCGQAGAKVVSNTQISYYTADGTTPGAIFRALLKGGPRVGGAQAIASISTRAVQDGGLNESNGGCVIADYAIKLSFLIKRPRIANLGVLSAADRAKWNQLNGFIIAHENQHKQIWLTCAADLDRRIRATTAPSCKQLAGKGQAMWKKMLADCDRKQRSFDGVQARQLEALPFMKRARSGAD